ncbi:MAG: DUF4870 domain-containing protein [Pirellulaceae bacterium]
MPDYLHDDDLNEYGKRYEPDDDELRWAMMAHLSMFVMAVAGPVVILMLMRDKSPYVVDQAKEALNFQLAMYMSVLVSLVTLVLSCAAPAFFLAALIMAVTAAVHVKNSGVYFRYPFIFRLVT